MATGTGFGRRTAACSAVVDDFTYDMDESSCWRDVKMKYRHELKFLVSPAQLALLKSRICHVARQDENQPSEDGYIITSLYFDDRNDKCLKETIDGYDIRQKYRIRIYGHDSSVIKLERKSKIHGMTAKVSALITEEMCRDMMQGKLPSIDKIADYGKSILTEMKVAGMIPKCIVQYNRKAFVYRTGNVRITFDENISGSVDIPTFLDERIPVMPLLEQGRHVLEVKYDNILPGMLAELLEIETLQQTAFSKYGYARNNIR